MIGFEKLGDFNDFIIRISTAAIPEPGTFAIMGLGLLAVGFGARRRARR